MNMKRKEYKRKSGELVMPHKADRTGFIQQVATKGRAAIGNVDLSRLQRITLSERQLYDLYQILIGGFAPLIGFLNKEDYISVVEHMRLADGKLWPIPIVLDQKRGHGHIVGEKVILCDIYGNPIALLTIESIFTPDKTHEARMVYGTTNFEHPGVAYLFNKVDDEYLGGKVTPIRQMPIFSFEDLRHTPAKLKERFQKGGYDKIIAFQTRNPIHRAHFEIMQRAAKKYEAHLLVHPVAGITKEGDIDYISRVRSYKQLYEKRMGNSATLSLLSIAMRMAGPREALWHTLIRKNYGATHFIIGRDHAGPGKDSNGRPFYGPYDAQKLVQLFVDEIGIVIEAVPEMVFVENKGGYFPTNEVQPNDIIRNISGTEFRKMLRDGEDIPEWFSFPEVVKELRSAVEKEKRRGVTIFFTGLSGAGKSTVAHILKQLLLERQNRSITLLDGDVVRQNLSKGLGFSREDRNTNIERIGFVAGEIARHGGIAICAAIAPYQESRDRNRQLIEQFGTYLEIFIKTPLSVCEQRDTKGLYEKARAGLLKNFTGIDDPYEEPSSADLVIETTKMLPEEAAEKVYRILMDRGIISAQT